ncbi:hypothetical protein K9N50_10725 [bacterium]|nr:hypothetical protein [bacterium]
MIIGALRDAGFDDKGIQNYIAPRRVALTQAGFSQERINNYFGSFYDNPVADELNKLGPETIPIQEDQEESESTIRERFKVDKALDGLPSPIATEVRKRGIELQREKEFGVITEEPFSMKTAISNIPRNVSEIVNSISSLVTSTGIFTYRFGKNFIKDANTVFSGKLMEGDAESAVGQQFAPLKKLPEALVSMTEGAKETLERQGVGLTVKNFVERHPVDAMLIGTALYNVAGSGTRLTLEGLNKVIPKASKVTTTLDDILSTKRTPIIYNMPVLEDDVVNISKSIEYPRQYSDNPLTKYIFQKSFDNVLEEYPGIKEMLATGKSKKLLNSMRNMYEEATFEERAKMHEDIFKQLNTLTKEEQLIIVPYLEGRTSLVSEPTEQFQGFERWYRTLQNNIQTDLLERGKLTPEIIENRMYQPLTKATGLTKEEVIAEFGDFSPVYVHHFFPDRYNAKMGIHFADTTGKRYNPSILKKSQGVQGYNESLKEILPKWTSEYIKYKNTEAFINDFTGKFGIKVNIKDVKEVKGGLQVGTKFYPGYKIIAPDNYLSFYRGKVDFYKEVSKRMDNATFDEALSDVISETVTKGSGEALSKSQELIKNRVAEALGNRGFSKGETEQMISRLSTGENESIEIVRERLITKGIGREDVNNLFQGVFKEYLGVSRNKPVYLIPEAMVGELESFATPVFGSKKVQDIIRLVVDKPTQIWKDSVLAITPRWIKNNVMGDIMFNTMEGVGPLSYSRGFQKLYKDVIPNELIKASFANVMKYNPKLGNTADTAIGGLVKELYDSKSVEGIAKIKDKGYAINTVFEQPFVRALYVKLAREKAVKILKEKRKIEKTKAPTSQAKEEEIIATMREMKNSPEFVDPIIQQVKETLPVFNLTGNFERKYIRRLMPFYNWYKFMAKYATKLPAKHPFKTVGARGLGGVAEGQREDVYKEMFPFMTREIEEGGIPEVFNHLWPTSNEEGKVTFFNARGLNPFETVEDFVQLDFINMMSPVVTVPYEQITGRTAFGDREFVSGEKGIEVTIDGIQYNDFEKVRPPLMDHILSQFPQYQLLKQSLVPARQYDTGTIFNPEPQVDEITGEPKYKIDTIEKMLNYMGIDKKTMDEIDLRTRWDNYQQRKRQAIGENFKKGQGTNAVSFVEIREIINEIKTDTKLWEKLSGEIRDIANVKANETRRLKEKIQMEEGTK